MELDQPVCDDVYDEPDPGVPNRNRRSFDPNELTWNIDRLDERTLPLDGEYCPAAIGRCNHSYNLYYSVLHHNSKRLSDFVFLQELVWMFTFLTLE